jgi:hypothetical protein
LFFGMASDMSAYGVQPPEPPEPTAMRTFFRTSELVMHMLTFLPTPSLITCMRVCRDFYEKIRDGGEYKKTLFLKPAKPKATYRAPSEVEGLKQYYKIRPPKPIHTTPTEPPYITNAPSGMGHWHDLGTPNPLFSREDHRMEYLPHIHIRFRMSAQKMLDHYDRMAQSSQGRIWNQMFICQPPTKTTLVRFNLLFEVVGGEPEMIEWHMDDERTMIERPEGIRVVDVVQKMRSEVEKTGRERNQKSTFEGDWLEVSCRRVADECCPFIQEALNANMVIGIKPGDTLVPVWTDQRRTIREKHPNGPFSRL